MLVASQPRCQLLRPRCRPRNFRIRDEIAAHETNPAATFYEVLDISPSASLDDINKAYRQKSRSLHPDKIAQQLRSDRAKIAKKQAKDNKKSDDAPSKPPTQAETKLAVKLASDRQARLSLIANILRGPGRDRYDHYLANGFPLWKGTDYYYNRYRPGLGTVLTGLFLVGGGAIHYLVLYMSWRRQKEFVQRYIKFARDTAWGGSLGIPGVDAAPPSPPTPAADEEDAGPQPSNRRQRRMMEKENKREGGRGGSKKSKKSSPHRERLPRHLPVPERGSLRRMERFSWSTLAAMCIWKSETRKETPRNFSLM